jgi:hypothetical protein
MYICIGIGYWYWFCVVCGDIPSKCSTDKFGDKKIKKWGEEIHHTIPHAYNYHYLEISVFWISHHVNECAVSISHGKAD